MSFDPYEFDRSLGQSQETQGQYTVKTFLWVMLGLLITFGVAMLGWVTNITLIALIKFPYIMLVTTIVTLVLAMTMSLRIEKMSVGTATVMFLLFAAVEGCMLSTILYVYQFGSVIFAFLAAALYFGLLAAYGHFTKTDLSGLRPILVSGLIFLIIFYLLSMFIPGFAMFDRIMCLVGIALFLGYTAYDTQKIKAYYQYYSGYPDLLAKASIFSALQLYLDFLNLFLRLLRYMGKRNN